MKPLLFVFIFLFSLSASAQYYFKDIIGTQESSNLVDRYRKNNVHTVTLKSYTIDNTPIENLSVQQEFSPAAHTLRTITNNDYLPASYLTTYFDETGRILKTTDSTAGSFVNTTVYRYNNAGQVQSILTVFGDSLTSLRRDEHIWQYDAQNRVRQMLRVKNQKDTAIVHFKLDDANNVVEEQETVRYIKEEPVYYYYDAKNRLTDIVRYNKKAARLLPEQMFEYATNNLLVQRTTVPQNRADYLIWRYSFDDKGLRTKEEIFDKQKELTGKVLYRYTFGN